jgi:serine phosphatase RsbU (regulator of sigma subunit)
VHTLFGDLGPLGPTYGAVDWSQTSLGPVAEWSDTLVNAVGLMLNTHFPVTLLWGPDYVLIYNDAYAPMIGEKHPAALGRPAREVFPEAWDVIGPLLDSAQRGKAIWVEDAHIPLHRRGFLEECYFTFSYSPVPNPCGVIEGVIDIATETTSTVRSGRRIELLTALSRRLTDAASAGDVRARALELLRGATDDLHGVDLWLGGPVEDAAGRLPARPADAAWDGSTEVVETHGEQRIAWLPLDKGGSSAPASSLLVVALSPHIAADEDYLAFLRLVAATLQQAVDRVHAAAAERKAADTQRGMSEAFQRSLLPEPIDTARPTVAVRYLAAVEMAAIGGDWYDWFPLPDGTLTVVIGDVAGHDQQAAAAMAQVRNMLRGVAHGLHPVPPRGVKRGLDLAMQSTSNTMFATAVLAQVTGQDEQALTFTWTNAGHPPPVLIHPDGTSELLATRPNLLLGLDPDMDCDEHRIDLPVGATIVLYTDGLIERRGVPLDQGFAWLLDTLRDSHEMDVEDLSDYLLSGIAEPDDDVALLVLRA